MRYIITISYFKRILRRNLVELNSCPVHGPLKQQRVQGEPVPFSIEVSLVIHDFAITVFAYQRFYFRTVESVDILSAATVQTAAVHAQRFAHGVLLTRLAIPTPRTAN